MDLRRDPVEPFRSLEDALRYRDAYAAAADRWAGTYAGLLPRSREEFAARLLAELPSAADGPTRAGTRDGAMGARPAW